MSNTTELGVFAGNSIQAVLNELLPQFERENGCRVSLRYAPAALTLDRISKGETADLIIINANAMDELARLGRIVPAGRSDLASNGIGVAALGEPRSPISVRWKHSNVRCWPQNRLHARKLARAVSISRV